MEVFNKIQENSKELIFKGKQNFKKSPKERINFSYVETRLESLESQWQSFCDTHRQIISEVSKKELDSSRYVTNCIYDETEELYLDYKTELKDALIKLKGKSQLSVPSSESINNQEKSKCFVKLPEISIPRFSGQYTEWPSFRDLFISLIHSNSKLDDVQKLHYLKSHLSGEAEQLLRHTPITEKNYTASWTQLVNRYDNKKYLSYNILKRFMNHKVLQHESSSAIRELLDCMNESLSALQNIGIDITSWDTIVIYIMSQKLDPDSRKQWESKANDGDDLPTLATFREFLHHKFRSLEFLDSKSLSVNSRSNRSNAKVMYVNSTITDSVKSGPSYLGNCPYCKATHKLYNCKEFAKENYEARHKFIQNSRLCFNCFGSNHSVFSCRQSTRCRVCKRKHHSLLHPQDSENVESQSKKVVVSSATTSEHEVASIVTCLSEVRNQVLLATAIVGVESSNCSVNLNFRCLLDQGSMVSLITESAVQALGLKKIPNKICISGVGGVEDSLASRSMVEVKVKSIYNPNFTMVVKAHVLTKLTSFLPSRKVNVQLWPELAHLQLADPKFDVPNRIDLLLGAEVYSQILVDGLIKGPPGCPIAQRTHLGWILSGQIHSDFLESETQQQSTVIVSMYTECNEDELLKKFWELEAEPCLVRNKVLTPEEQACEEHFQKTTKRDISGRYVVELPFRPQVERNFGDTRAIAVRKLRSLERRFIQNAELKNDYMQVLNEYLALGHMEKVNKAPEETPGYVWLPHHAVIRKDKSTTKTRVVFNASDRSANGISLNDTLMVGPRLQSDLRHIIMRWRQHPICLMADIIKMYRQVNLKREHTDYHRIVWRDENNEIQDYRLLTVTFGTSSAPYLAVKTLQQVAVDEGMNYPLAAEKVRTDFYMDDLLTGCDTEKEALRFYEEMNKLLSKGGFRLQKWSSNSAEVMKILDGNIAQDREFKEDDVTKVVGLFWNRRTDDFSYRVKFSSTSPPVTKREIIGEICRLYDPLGWIAPCIITAKIFIQRLWITGFEWDDKLPAELLSEWLSYREELVQLANFQIPRWVQQRSEETFVELHGFSDASHAAYAAAVYIRCVSKDAHIRTHLLTAKTKVAPIKQISIPRLELCGAVLVTKLLVEVAEVLNIPSSQLHAWTDSTIVLAWLSDHPSRWKTFIANRTSEILNYLEPSRWSYIQSKENPADCASRGILPSELVDNKLWKYGPDWLSKDVIQYGKPLSICTKTDLEERKLKVHATTTENCIDMDIFLKFSSLRKLIRVVAYCRRFLKFKDPVETRAKFLPYLSAEEIRNATMCCIRQHQLTWFHEEMEDLKHKNIVKKSKIDNLNPWIDNVGVMRVGGRLENSYLKDSSKHPVIISGDSCLAKLIIADAHNKTLHGGPQLTINYIRSTYWVTNLKNLVRRHVHKCVPCVRNAARVKNQLMGQLPSCRVTPKKPFLYAGVDYAGPINIRVSKGRGHKSGKGYICLFVCMATRAVHIEAVSDLTAEGFLAAFKRFVARRGRCTQLWSDNGTNFVGASKELRNLFVLEKSKMSVEIASLLANNGTDWHFIPPHAPNFGGVWEAGIKSTKHHLRRIIGESTLTFEELTTVLAQVEACLNSRPMSVVSTDADDPNPLTPGHFLIGEPLLVAPDNNFEQSKVINLRRWQLTQKMIQHFWKRWSREYLTQFFQRYKWKCKVPEIKVGDVVLVKEDNLPPTKWLYGLVVEEHPGNDKITRVVTLRHKGSLIKRPTSKLCVLPVCEEQ